MKVVVYTAIMAKDPKSDIPLDMPGQFTRIPGWDYILITNHINGKKIFKTSGWNQCDIRIMSPPDDEMPPKSRRGEAIYAARWCKWHPDSLFSNYDVAIWVDGWKIPDFNQVDNWYTLVDSVYNQTNSYDIVFDKHDKNKCVYEEHKSIIFCEKDTYSNILKTTKYVKTMGFPTDYGVFWTGCYIYRIGSKYVGKVMKDLWDDMLIYTYRDQALLTYEIWRNAALDIWGTAPLARMVIPICTDQNHCGYI